MIVVCENGSGVRTKIGGWIHPGTVVTNPKVALLVKDRPDFREATDEELTKLEGFDADAYRAEFKALVDAAKKEKKDRAKAKEKHLRDEALKRKEAETPEGVGKQGPTESRSDHPEKVFGE